MAESEIMRKSTQVSIPGHLLSPPNNTTIEPPQAIILRQLPIRRIYKTRKPS